MTPEVTVLMSCYNARRWLHEASDSVLAQTFKNFEFILIDDGSTDETWTIIESYRDRDQRIVAISKNNTGLTDSLNMGISQARGAWIARQDADDVWEPTKLEEQVNFLRNHPEVVLLGTGFVEIDEHGRSVKKHRLPPAHRTLVRRLTRWQPYFPHSSALFKRDIAQLAGGYNQLFRKTQDGDLWMRLAEHGNIACLKNCLVRVRKHSAQISNAVTGTSQIVYGIAASTSHFLRIHGCNDPSSTDRENWGEFLRWVNRRMEEEGAFARLKAWNDARAAYFSAMDRSTGLFRFGVRLLQSGHAGTLMREKFFGSSLPRRLARDWMKRSCAVS